MQGESPGKASAPTAAVFLSYASQDAAAAKRICDGLRAAGIEVWFDQSELRGGDAWDRQIRKQIHDCALFLPVISANSQARLEGYFRREWKLAADRTHDMAEEKAFLVPVVIDATSEREASVPDRFRDVQWTQLPAGEASVAFIDRVSSLLSAEQPRPVSAGTQGQPVKSRDPARNSRPLSPLTLAASLIGAVALILVAYLAFDRLWMPRRGATPTGQTVSTPERSIAVLPFVDMSEKHDQEYFSDGLSEELIDLLTRVPDLRVPARTSSFFFKGKSDDVASIAQKLRVAHVLEGSVRKSGDTIRVTAQLIRADNGYHLWSETYDRDLKDVFKVQDEIASEVVQALKMKLAGPIAPDAASTENASAHNLLMEGRYFQERWAKGDSERAIASYQQALSEDPRYALAWTELAWALLWQLPWDYERTTTAAQTAIELSPDLALAHATRGWCASLRGYEWDMAASEFDQALAIEPANMRALYGKGRLARVLRRYDESLRYYEAAIRQDPINANPMDGISTTLVAMARSAEAVRYARRALEISPDIQWGHWYLARALLSDGQADAAFSEAQLEPTASLRLSILALIQQARRNTAAAETTLQELLATEGVDKSISLARVYGSRGASQDAVAWLEKARVSRSGWLGEITSDPAFDPIRSDAGFAAFLRKLKLPE